MQANSTQALTGKICLLPVFDKLWSSMVLQSTLLLAVLEKKKSDCGEHETELLPTCNTDLFVSSQKQTGSKQA